MKKIICIGICIFALISSVAFCDARISAANFENRTIIIGTHAIHLDGINEEIVKKAQASMTYKDGDEIKEQNNIYFKSDLASGTWFDITSATSIENVISSKDKIVDNSVIDALYLTHYTNAKGATIEFSTGKLVAVDDINDLSDPKNMMDELLGVDTQRDVVSGNRKMDYDMDDDAEDDLKSALRKEYNLLNDVFDQLEGAALDTLKHKMDIFTQYINYLKNDIKAADEAVQVAVSIKSQLQTEYDIDCYNMERARVETIAGKMNPNTAKDSINALWEAVNKIEKKVGELEGELGGDSAGTVLYELKQDYIDDIYQMVIGKQSDKTLPILAKILSVDRIYADKLIDIPSELSVLGEGRDIVMARIQTTAAQTDTKAYKDAKSSGATALVLKSVMEADIATLKGLVDDAVSIKDYTVKRLDSDGEKSQALKVVLDGLTKADGYLKANDDYYYDYNKVLMDAIQALEDELAAMNANQDPEIQAKKSELEELKDTMKNLKEDYLQAVDDGDLDMVDAIESALDALEEDINALQGNMSDDYKALMDQSLSEEGLSDDGKATLMGLSSMMSALDQARIDDLKGAFDGLVSAIGREDVFSLEEATDAYDAAKDKVSDLLSDTYLADLDAQVDDAFKGKYKALIAQGRYQTASLLMDAIGDVVDTEAVTAGMDKGGTAALDKLLAQSASYGQVLAGVTDAKAALEALSNMDGSDLGTDGGGSGTDDDANQATKLALYQEKLNLYQNLEKQRLIIDILLRRQLLSSDNYRGDVKLEAEKAAFIKQLRQLDGQKYAQDDLKVIETREQAFSADIKESMVSALQVIVETYNVPLFNPVLERDGVYYVPTRTLFEAFGGRVDWYQDQQMAVIDYEGQHIELYTGTKNILVNDIAKTIDNLVYLVEDKTYVPMDFIETYYRQFYIMDDEVFIMYSAETGARVENILGGE
ncbi:MAG: hypothetical protein JXO44_05910 [Clostridia bacterium]|nr:hypothetical protein [Clostridia bacterium]